MTKNILRSIKSYVPFLTVIIPGIQICSEKKSEASIAGGLPTTSSSSGSDDRRHVPSAAPGVSVASLVQHPGLLHQSLLHHQAAQAQAAAHSMQGNILERRFKPFPRPFQCPLVIPVIPCSPFQGCIPHSPRR